MSAKEEREAWVRFFSSLCTSTTSLYVTRAQLEDSARNADIMLAEYKKRFGDEAILLNGLGECQWCATPLTLAHVEINGIRYCNEKCKGDAFEEYKKSQLTKSSP